MTLVRVAHLFALLLVTGWSAHAETMSIDAVSAGTIERGFLEIADTGDGGSKVPITVAQGAEEGPTLALIAGTHGYEYAPILALQAVAKSIDAASLKGRLIIVHVANMPSFMGRTIYYSPVDGMNLNRAFPGKSDGSLSERIAHAITTEVIEHADYVVDMHSGDGNEALRPYIYMPKTGDPALDEKIKAMALAFGIDHIIIDERPVSPPDASVFTDMTALSRGIPAMTTEAGQLGSTDQKWVMMNVRGARNLMRHLGMLPGEVAVSGPPVWLGEYQVVTAPSAGVFKPLVKDGYVVAKDGTLGTLQDFFGAPIATIRAPFSGVVNYVIATPPVGKGEPVAMVSKILDE